MTTNADLPARLATLTRSLAARGDTLSHEQVELLEEAVAALSEAGPALDPLEGRRAPSAPLDIRQGDPVFFPPFLEDQPLPTDGSAYVEALAQPAAAQEPWRKER